MSDGKNDDIETKDTADGGEDTKDEMPEDFVPSGTEKNEIDDKKNPFEGNMSSNEMMSDEVVSPQMKLLQSEIEQRKKEYHELYDKYVRLIADFDNYKKRVAKEKADIMAYGNEELIKEILGVVDNLERAIKHSGSAEDVGSIVEGVRLVHRMFLNSLEKFGVKAINISKGDRFDPRYHQAVEHVVSNEITPGLIISEILKGYTLKDKLLRPSVVVVARAEEKREPREGGRTEIADTESNGGNNSDLEEIS
ncbi:MAG TPA: nucleotide exchange factor GrpE [Thermodesulfobacteriota bacterium]|nr:nucleotide exchange factor GrpE [Thermodesulfobacteriota bacterium]